MRTQLEIQEKALAALVRLGEAEYSHTLKAEKKKGIVIRASKRMYHICKESQYGLRTKPREHPIVKQCCASCQNHDYMDIPIEGQKRVRQGVRVCQLFRREVAQCEICNQYRMIEAYERV